MMSPFQQQMADFAANVVRNTDLFAQEYQFEQTGHAPIAIVGILDNENVELKDGDEDKAQHLAARLRGVDPALADQTNDEGWFDIGSARYFIIGDVERTPNTITLLLSQTKHDTLRAAYPHGAGRTLKHK